MQTRKFIGKSVSLKDLHINDSITYYNVGEYDDHYAVVEIDLHNFEVESITDKTGRNAYSIELSLEGERIVKIGRIGHCHMHGGGSSEVLQRFPHKSLEEEAEKILSSLFK